MARLMVSPQKIRQAREGAGLTQENAAHAAGVTRATVQNVERGRRDPQAWVLAALARAYGVSIESLFDTEPNGNAFSERRKQPEGAG